MSATPPDRYAVIGNPVGHSRSPAIHAAFAQATDQSLDYGRLTAPLDAFEPTVRSFAASGAKGCNVTVPFKFEAFALCPRRTPRATLAQAANVICFDDNGWLADNTDGSGLMRDIEINAGQHLAQLRVLLIGAGGAAAGVLGPLIECGPAEVVLSNRSPDKAHQLMDRHADLAQRCGVQLRVSDLAAPGLAFDVLINATASSLGGVVAPVPASALKPGGLAMDLMYGPAARPFLDWAAQHGARTRDGLGMLVEQAAEAFAIWRGVRPPTAAPLQALRAEVDATQPG